VYAVSLLIGAAEMFFGQAAEAAYALDVASGRVGPSTSASAQKDSAAAPKPKAKTGKPSDPYTNYTTAASLGYRDPDAEEAQQRMHAGTPGAWTVVPVTKTEETSKGDEVERGEKRRVEEVVDDEDDVRAFKLRKKTVRVAELYDPDLSNRTGSKVESDEPNQAGPSLFRKRKVRPS